VKSEIQKKYPDLNPDFIFVNPGYNMRSTEINAVMGRTQLKRLDANNLKRTENFQLFLDKLDSKRFFTDYAVEGSSNYAFTVLLNQKDDELRNRMEMRLRDEKVEFRRGMSGGGNQVRQPYLRDFYNLDQRPEDYPNTEHVHFYGYYIGNYPGLEREKIEALCKVLNTI
jgi:CDP-4-dehydro-6-deoxyglucose reductase, E1